MGKRDMNGIQETLNHFAGRLRAYEFAIAYLLGDQDKHALGLYLASLEADLFDLDGDRHDQQQAAIDAIRRMID